MFTKDEIKARYKAKLEEARQAGKIPEEAAIDLALIILGCSAYGQKQRSGEGFAEHPLQVATTDIQSRTKRMIAILHDVVEDSDWTLEDLQDVGFSDRVIRGVDGVTRREGEPYLDFIVRCGQSGDDAITVKTSDLKHNSDHTRYRNVGETPKQALYNLARHYLIDLKKERDDGTNYNTPGTSIVDYIKSREE